MSEHKLELTRRAFIGGAAAFGATSLVIPQFAFAETSAEKQAQADSVRNQLVGLQADLEQAANDYYAALEEQQTAQNAMDEQQTKIDEANGKIDELQGKLSTRARSMYRSGSSTFIDFLLGATSFSEFTQNWDLLNQMNASDANLVDETKTTREQLQQAKDEYARQEQIASQKADEAAGIRDQAQQKVNDATALVNSLDEEARKLLEQEQAAAAAAAAQQAAAQEAAQRQASGGGNGGSSNNGGAANNGGGNGGDGGNNGGNDAPSDNGGGNSYTPVYPGTSGGGGGDWSAVVGYAYSCIGVPYVWGGSSPSEGLDCSGLVVWCYAQCGRSLPHQTESLYAAASNIVSVSAARPGDVLYRYGHVGIAAGYGGMPYVHAPTFGAYVRDTDDLSWSGFTAALQF